MTTPFLRYRKLLSCSAVPRRIEKQFLRAHNVDFAFFNTNNKILMFNDKKVLTIIKKYHILHLTINIKNLSFTFLQE